MSDSDDLKSESDQPPAKKAKSHYDTLLSHSTQQPSQGSQNIIETGHDQDKLNTRRTINVIVNNNKKERQKRYREQNRDKLKQREAERRKRIQYSQSIAGPFTSSNTNRIELNDKEITTAQSSSGLEKTHPLSIQRNERGKINALQKKRERQQRYRQQNKDKLKQREAERRRLQNAETITELCTSPNIEFTEIINDPIMDEMSTNSRSVAGLGVTQHVVVEVFQRNGRVHEMGKSNAEHCRDYRMRKKALKAAAAQQNPQELPLPHLQPLSKRHRTCRPKQNRLQTIHLSQSSHRPSSTNFMNSDAHTHQINPRSLLRLPITTDVLNYPKSSTVYPYSSTVYPYSSTMYPDSSTVYPYSSTVYPDPSAVYPYSSTMYPDSSIVDKVDENVHGSSLSTPMHANHNMIVRAGVFCNPVLRNHHTTRRKTPLTGAERMRRFRKRRNKSSVSTEVYDNHYNTIVRAEVYERDSPVLHNCHTTHRSSRSTRAERMRQFGEKRAGESKDLLISLLLHDHDYDKTALETTTLGSQCQTHSNMRQMPSQPSAQLEDLSEGSRTATASSHKEKPKKVTGKDSRYTVGECHRTYSNYAERKRVKKPEDAQLNTVHGDFPVKVKLETEYDNVDESEQYVDHKHSCIQNGGSYSYDAKNGKLNETVLGVDTNAEVKLEIDMEENCPLHEVYFGNEDVPGINIKQEELSADINSRVKLEVEIEENWYPNEVYFENADVSEIHIKQEESPRNS